MLIDPTRPPAELSASTVPSELQSIIISPTRRAAIINGQTVELGGKAGDVRLIEVSEGSVVLQGEKGRQVLTLFPNVKIDKKAVLPPMEEGVKHLVRKGKQINQPAKPERRRRNEANTGNACVAWTAGYVQDGARSNSKNE